MAGNKRADYEHHELVQDLEGAVRSQYAITMTEVEVRNPETGQVVGEIDLVGIVDDFWDVYEVKVSHNLPKARRQLRNLRHYLRHCGNVRTYYYSGAKGEVIEIDG